MKCKIFVFNAILLIYLTNLTVSDSQLPNDRLPDRAIEQFSPGALVYTVAFSPDGQLLASGGDDNAVILWNVADGSEHAVFTEHTKSVRSVAFSPDGQRLASASLDGFVRLWPVSSERKRTSLRDDNSWVESVAFSPDGKMLVSGGGDQEGSVTLWDVSQQRSIFTFPVHGSLVESVAFSPDGQLFASASRDKTIKLWDVDSQHMRNILIGHNNVVHDVAFSPDSETLASVSRDKTIKLWEVSSGRNIATFEIQNSLYAYAESVAFSPDGRLLASACVDYTVRLWDVISQSEVATLTGHHGGVTSVAFSPNGRMLASGSRDRTVLLWDISYFSPERFGSESKNLPHRQDTTPPDIVIHSPIKRVVDATVRQIPVKVNVTDNSRITEVWINSTKAAVLGTDVFTAMIPLNYGENEIRITATDARGNMGTHRFLIVREASHQIDTGPPEIVIHSPKSRPAELTSNPLTVEGNVTDAEGIVEVRVNGLEAELSKAGAFIAKVLLDFRENEIRITATDARGNMGTALFTVEDTKGPDIHIDSATDDPKRGFRPTVPEPVGAILVSGTVTDPSGVAEVMVNDTAARVAGDRFSAIVQLTDGNDLIRVTATDNWGNQSVEKIIRPVPIPPRKDYALLFAVDTYDHWPQLRYPLVDALEICQDLENIYGFEVELIHNPTKEDILRELHKYAQKKYTPEDQLLIFFAGHGDFDTVSNMGYLVSQDTQKPEDDSFRLSYFSHSYFRDFIDGMSCEHIFLVIDTCYSGTFDRRMGMRGAAEDASRPFSQTDIKRIFTYTTRSYLTSGANEQVPDNSLFIRALLKALRGKGGSDNILTIKEILTHFEDLNNPKPCFGEFGRNEPGSDFLFIAN